MCAAEQLAFILQTMNTKTIIKIDLDFEEFVEALKTTPIESRVSLTSYSKNVRLLYNFLPCETNLIFRGKKY